MDFKVLYKDGKETWCCCNIGVKDNISIDEYEIHRKIDLKDLGQFELNICAQLLKMHLNISNLTLEKNSYSNTPEYLGNKYAITFDEGTEKWGVNGITFNPNHKVNNSNLIYSNVITQNLSQVETNIISQLLYKHPNATNIVINNRYNTNTNTKTENPLDEKKLLGLILGLIIGVLLAPFLILLGTHGKFILKDPYTGLQKSSKFIKFRKIYCILSFVFFAICLGLFIVGLATNETNLSTISLGILFFGNIGVIIAGIVAAKAISKNPENEEETNLNVSSSNKNSKEYKEGFTVLKEKNIVALIIWIIWLIASLVLLIVVIAKLVDSNANNVEITFSEFGAYCVALVGTITLFVLFLVFYIKTFPSVSNCIKCGEKVIEKQKKIFNYDLLPMYSKREKTFFWLKLLFIFLLVANIVCKIIFISCGFEGLYTLFVIIGLPIFFAMVAFIFLHSRYKNIIEKLEKDYKPVEIE